MNKSDAKRLYGILNRPSPLVLRLLRGPCSQTALADTMNVSGQTVSDWETGNNSPGPGTLFDLLHHYTVWTAKLGWPALDILLAAAAEDKPTDNEPTVTEEPTP